MFDATTENDVFDPAATLTLVGEVVMVGVVIIVIGVEALQPETVYTTDAVPAVTPVTIPVPAIVAEPVPLVIDQVPPPVAFVNAGVVLPVQTVNAPPLMVAFGEGFTVTL